jgi:hypothetical protein
MRRRLKIIDSITALQENIVDAKDLSIGIMIEERDTELEMELIEVVHGLASVLKRIQSVKEMAIKGEQNDRLEG